jgi:hypothetical protein
MQHTCIDLVRAECRLVSREPETLKPCRNLHACLLDAVTPTLVNHTSNSSWTRGLVPANIVRCTWDTIDPPFWCATTTRSLTVSSRSCRGASFGVERQLSGPNPTDFPLIAERPEAAHLPPYGPSRRRSLYPTGSRRSDLAAGTGLHCPLTDLPGSGVKLPSSVLECLSRMTIAGRQTPAASGMLKVTPPRSPSTMFHSPLPGFTGASADLLHQRE